MKLTVLLALMFGSCLMLHAGTPIDPKNPTTKKTEITSTMIGYRDTLLFYAFAEQQAVLVVRIDQSSKDFAIRATLHRFAKDIPAEGLAKWINNQHSDGLFPDVAEPVSRHDIPAATAVITSKHMIGVATESRNPLQTGWFQRYEVGFRFENVPPMDGIIIRNFSDTATVYLSVANAAAPVDQP